MLFWQAGWLKTSLLLKMNYMLGENLAITMSDLSSAALRGTVEAGRFVSPFTLKRPFAICTEFGQVIKGSFSEELIQKLLNVLEEGIVTVSLGKIALLGNAEIEKAKEDYGIEFIDNNTFTYKTNWILLAGTYDKKFLIDNALESRFNIVVPNQKLTSKLTKHVINSPAFSLDEDVVIAFREAITSRETVDCNIKLPEEIYEEELSLTPRDAGGLLSYLLCSAWWGKKIKREDIVSLAVQFKKDRTEIWKSSEDKVFDCILNQYKSVEEIMDETGIQSNKTVYTAFKKLGAVPTVNPNDADKKRKWTIK